MADGTATGLRRLQTNSSPPTPWPKAASASARSTPPRNPAARAADEQEFTYFSYLPRISKFKLEGDELELYTESEVEPMLFTTSEGGGFFSW